MADPLLLFYSYFQDCLIMIVTTMVGASIVRYIVNKKRIIELAIKLPGPRAYPIIGNALKFACEPDQLLERIVDVIAPYADVTPMRLWMGPMLYVIITEPRDIEVVLNSQQATSKGSAYKFLYPFIGNGLISGSGKSWKAHRKIISHILNQRTLDSFIETFDRRSKEFVKKLEPLANGEVFDIFHSLEGCTIDLVCETVMGYTDINALDNPNKEFVHYTAEMYKIIHNRMMKIWLYPDWIFRITSNYSNQKRAQTMIHNFTERCIEAGRQDMLKEKSKTCILHRLLTVNSVTNELTEEELRDEIYTIYIASQDTLAVTSSFAVLMLGIHGDVQKKARSEVDEVIGVGDVNIESLSKLKYLEMVIKETLRLFPIAPLMVRQLNGELKLDNSILPKDCQVVIAPYATHRSSKFWENPENFLPERFAIKETVKRHPYTFIPFSGGPMGCIGQKYALTALKMILANILQKYVVESDVTLRDIKLKTDISIRSMNGYKISLQARTNITKYL
ncbi:cytochrome P450 4g15 [Nasonia vitripennis]|uniref:Cytochrome P450 n=1 Tax=Nasonia vitripennis TaxID=7425 RepID=A0A7M7M6D9_NASVI|nr:cytochrome P450 4g15 [Nasonia vitripennis]